MSADRSAALALALALGFAGCAPRFTEPAGFLGDYRRLAPEPGGDEASVVFIDPRADFARYDEVQVEPVTVWLGADTPLDAALRRDLQHMADLLEGALRQQLGQEFDLVDRAGPHTLRLRTAIAQAPGVNVQLDLASRPGKQTPTAPEALSAAARGFAAAAAIEVEALDALSNRRLAAAVDRRAAEQLLQRAPRTWADVEQAWQDWADGVQAALAAFRLTAREDEPPAPTP